PDAVRPLLHRHVCERGTDRAVPRQPSRGCSAVRHHVCCRPLSHGDGHGPHFRDFRCDLPLVPEGHRANAERDARQVSLLVTFLGAYAIYFPMHYIGLLGVPRRYFEMGDMAFVPQSATTLNGFITMAALIVGFAQMVFLFNMIWSLSKGKPA